LDHVAVTLGLFVAQTKLRMLISQDILNIHHAYAEWVWHFLGFKVLAESFIYGLSYLWFVCLCARLSVCLSKCMWSVCIAASSSSICFFIQFLVRRTV